MDVVGSTGMGEALLELERMSRSSTDCTVCATALTAFVTACDGLDFKVF